MVAELAKEAGRDLGLDRFPSSEALEKELERERNKFSFVGVLGTFAVIAVAIFLLAAVASMTVCQIRQMHGNGMLPEIQDGSLLITVSTGKYRTGDIVCFRVNGSEGVKRIAASAGDTVSMDDSGATAVNGSVLFGGEMLLFDAESGEAMPLPAEVPEECVVVASDNMEGGWSDMYCIKTKYLTGKAVFAFTP